MKLEVLGVEFSYNSKRVLKNVSFSLESGEVGGVIGPNGSGKTTLLRCINKILEPKKGSILIEGEVLNSLKRGEIAKRIGYVPQIESSSFPSTVFDAVLLGRKPHINWKPRPKDLKLVSDVIDMLGLKELAMRDINELSGGQRQKVIIARAFAQEPEVLLLDEPTSNLDLKHQLEVFNLVRRVVKDNQLSAVVAIHDLNLAARYCDKLIIMNDGKVFAAGSVDILTPENIESVYNVKVSVTHFSKKTVVIPEEPFSIDDGRQ